MKVCELIEELKKCPHDAVVEFECDDDWYNGEIRECETRHYETGDVGVYLKLNKWEA